VLPGPLKVIDVAVNVSLLGKLTKLSVSAIAGLINANEPASAVAIKVFLNTFASTNATISTRTLSLC
jgi:hypothetical protein